MGARKPPQLINGDSAKLYDVMQMAQMSGKSRETIYAYIQDGLFPHARRLGKRDYFIPHEDARMFLGFDPETGVLVGVAELEKYRRDYGLWESPLARIS